MVDDIALRRYIEPWITVATVFLAVEFAVLSIFISAGLAEKTESVIPFYFGFGMIVCNVISLATFLGGRDPRQNKYKTQSLLDAGVSMLAASLVFAALLGSFALFLVTNDLVLGIISAAGLIGAMLIYFPYLYFKNLHKKDL